MDPFTLMMGAGLLMQAGGSIGSIFGMNSANEEQHRQAELERQIQDQRRMQMQLTTRRQQMEVIRNSQLQRSMSLNAATAQGAQFGTGLPGGQAQVSGQSNIQLLGLSQNQEIGNNIFDLNSQISDSKLRMSDIQTNMATWQGMQGFGASLMGAAGKFGALTATNNTPATTPMNFGPTYGGAINMMGRGGIY